MIVIAIMAVNGQMDALFLTPGRTDLADVQPVFIRNDFDWRSGLASLEIGGGLDD